MSRTQALDQWERMGALTRAVKLAIAPIPGCDRPTFLRDAAGLDTGETERLLTTRWACSMSVAERVYDALLEDGRFGKDYARAEAIWKLLDHGRCPVCCGTGRLAVVRERKAR